MAREDIIKGRSSGDRKRMYPGTQNNLRPDNAEIRQKEAAERFEAFNKLTNEQKLEILDARLGKSVGATKQRARYLKLIEEARIARETEKAAEAARAAAKKDKQEKQSAKPAKNTK